MSATRGVCGQRVRVSKGVLIKHRDAFHHGCENSGCDVDANRPEREEAPAPR